MFQMSTRIWALVGPFSNIRRDNIQTQLLQMKFDVPTVNLHFVYIERQESGSDYF